MDFKNIAVTAIIIEECCRSIVEDPKLALSINNCELHECPIVEGPIDGNKYFLVEGFKRIHAYKQLGRSNVLCVVNEPTNPQQRMIKRISTEFTGKRKTGFDRYYMVKYLLDAGYSLETISQKSGISISTLKVYCKASSIDSNTLKEAESQNAGLIGLVKISELKISEELKSKLQDKYIDKNLLSKDVDFIKKIVRVQGFQNLPDEVKEECFEEGIRRVDSSRYLAKTIVNSKLIKHNNNEVSTREHCKYLFELLDYVITNSPREFVKILNSAQRNGFESRVIKLTDIYQKHKTRHSYKSDFEDYFTNPDIPN